MGRPKGSTKERLSNTPKTANQSAVIIETQSIPNADAVPSVDTSRPFPQDTSSGDKGERLSIRIEDGKIRTEGMHGKTSEQLREVIKTSLQDPAFSQFLGVAATGEAGTVVSPEDAAFLLDFEASLVTTYFGMRYKMKLAEVKEIVAWSQAEHELLDARTAKVLTKYCPESIKENFDWVLVVGQICSMSLIKFAKMAKYAEEKKDAGKTSDPIPTPKVPVIVPDSALESRVNGSSSMSL